MAHSPRFQALTRILGESHRRNQLDGRLAKLAIARWTRRRFLRLAALSFGSAIATTTLSGSPQVQSQTPSSRIAIVGGGIAGLNAAYQLKKQGYRATVYEARPRLGGRIHTRRDVLDRGIYLDFGGLFVNSEHEDLLTLVDEFNLSTFNLSRWTSAIAMLRGLTFLPVY